MIREKISLSDTPMSVMINLSFVLSQTSQGAEYWLDVMTGASDD